MIDGLYWVAFESNVGGVGDGTVVVANGAVNGGDYGYCYQGTLDDTEGDLHSVITVEKFNPRAESIFGPLNRFSLDVAGPAGEEDFTMSGHIVEQPQMRITIRGKYIKPLV